MCGCSGLQGIRLGRIVAGYVIRPYTADDLDELLDVWYQASLIAHSFLSEEFLTAERQQVADIGSRWPRRRFTRPMGGWLVSWL